MWNLGSVGTAMMIMSNDSIWAGSKGFADIPNNVSLAPGNLFRIGSISKIFIVTAALRLCMQQKLSLDDKMADYLDNDITEKIANGKTVTIRQLMNHTSKIPDYFTASMYMGYFNYSYDQLSGPELIKKIYGKPAMEKNGYSNSNSILLGMVVAAIEGCSAYDVIKQQVLYSLGLNTTFVGTEEPSGLVRAYSNLYGNGKIIDVSDLDRRAVGGEDNTEGGIISNVQDLIVIMKAITDTGFIDSALQTEMMKKVWFEPSAPIPGYEGYSLGLSHVTTKYGHAVGHWGNCFGFNGIVLHFTDSDLYVAILVNTFSEAVNFMYNEEIYDYFF